LNGKSVSKEDAILELNEKLIAARRTVADLKKEIEELTGRMAPTGAFCSSRLLPI